MLHNIVTNSSFILCSSPSDILCIPFSISISIFILDITKSVSESLRLAIELSSSNTSSLADFNTGSLSFMDLKNF